MCIIACYGHLVVRPGKVHDGSRSLDSRQNLVRTRTPELAARVALIRTLGSVDTANPTGIGTVPTLSTVTNAQFRVNYKPNWSVVSYLGPL